MSHWNITIPHRIPLREVWPHEQYDFSAWVKDNIIVVNEQVGLTIDPESLDPESATGSFAADLVGTATDDASVAAHGRMDDDLHLRHHWPSQGHQATAVRHGP